jgi:hypothetical protein
MLSSLGQPVVVIACTVLQDLLSRTFLEDLSTDVTFMEYGLHRVPCQLRSSLQEAIDSIREPSVVVLGYGLCGNGLVGLRPGRHTLLVPRADDCITLLLGSRASYLREFEAVPGTYYLSKGWLESGSHPLKEYEEYLPRYGSEQALWLMDQQYQHYERLLLVAHSQADLDAYRPQAQAVARFCERWGMRYEEMLGSDRYVRRLTAAATTLDKADDDFLIVPPGGGIRQEHFVR